MELLKKLAIVAVFAVLLLPFLPRLLALLPEPVSFERAQLAFYEAGLQIQEWQEVAPSLEAVAQVCGVIKGATVNLYQYDHEGKLVKQLEYQREDPGQAMVEAWGLAEAVGAAQQQRVPSRAARRGMFMLVATGEDPAVLDEIVAVFRAL